MMVNKKLDFDNKVTETEILKKSECFFTPLVKVSFLLILVPPHEENFENCSVKTGNELLSN